MEDIHMSRYYRNMTLAAMLISILWVILVNTQPFSDFAYYNRIANQVASGGQWGDTYTSVGYSIVLGFIYKIFGNSLASAKVFNLVLTFLNYGMFYIILQKANLNEKRRKIIYGLFVFFPSNIFYNSVLATEILFTTVLLFITLIYFYDIKYKYVIIGILTAADAMVKPFFMVFFFAIFILEICLRMKFKDVLKHTAVVLIVSCVSISPWIYRNTKLIGEFTSISNNSGIVLYINNNSQNKSGVWMDAKNVENSIVNTKEYINANATEKNKMLSKAAKKWILSHPLSFVKLGFTRLFKTYLDGGDLFYSLNGTNLNLFFKILFAVYTYIARYVIFIPAIILMPLYSVKVIRNLIKKREIDSYSLYNLICFYMFSCVYFITEGQPRYSFPSIFIVVYFFSYFGEKISIPFVKKSKSLGN
ncbi:MULTISPECIES: membrane protein [Clostridium]|uniref:Glycosyltransferase RgtA/B/C/D-like domain-containing protein n=3 Tax=Clostridium TaxID=1485 RepID=A0A3M0SUH6_9CLOT|nr:MULTISPECIES: membrane protein [Clostridium]ADK16344.1 putative membrane protein [Clostridium ljungdahlii DSM 13528]AGY75421.1 hypothetical protein CAETHG_1196 [Clostridium autoethanogenum DSM 10061]ALU35587.1 Hypothetical protein CLAU_1158 [Clostridium autoethanogenum DSM 10061]OAA89782.1 hypothetical protein WX45_01619 [Clostridium ljungdahlii DSM 13528]OVY52351.1 hypothetical protein WX72_01248 [Clostridium autoethanogenum]